MLPLWNPSNLSCKLPRSNVLHVFDHKKMKYMSKSAIHVGLHVHPPHSFVPREAVIAAESAIQNQHTLNPTTIPSCLKIDATESLMAHLAPESALGMSAKDVHYIWDSLMTLAFRENFQAILRMARMESLI